MATKEKDYRWETFGIEKDKLPELVEPGTILGYINKDVSEETGIKIGIPVIASGFR